MEAKMTDSSYWHRYWLRRTAAQAATARQPARRRRVAPATPSRREGQNYWPRLAARDDRSR